MVTELSRFNLGVAFFKTLISRSYLINFLITGGFLWFARTVFFYSQLNLTSDRLLSDTMWFLCRFRHISYVESGSYRNLIDSFCQHFHGKHRNKNTEPKQNKTYSRETFRRWRDISMGHRQTRNRFISWTSKTFSSLREQTAFSWNSSRMSRLLSQANSFHPPIKFTAEISDKEITFLDTVVNKGERFQKDAILDKKTHCKPTETFQYTHYTSSHPPGVKEVLSKAKLLHFYEQIPRKKISRNLSLISKHAFSRVDTLKT